MDETTAREVAASLAARLASLELTEDEQHVLGAVVARAVSESSDEVSGFGWNAGVGAFHPQPGWYGFKGTDEELQAAFGQVLGIRDSVVYEQ